jgi:[ribosomal protein S5]-alanine N-acetyltransferase
MIEKLTSLNLELQPISQQFATATYLSWLNDSDVNKYLDIPKENNLADLIEYIKEVEEKKIYMWAILLKNGNKHIGNIKIDPVDTKHRYGEYGILLGDKEEWGKGYAKEATTTVINYCFDSLNLRKVNLGVVENNTAAVALYEKLGFIHEGVDRFQRLYDDEYCHVIRMAAFNPKIKY